MSDSRFVIGLTGSMGSGKSTVRNILSESIPVIDCDSINSRLLETGAAGWRELKENGLLFADETGAINRQTMADAMFSDPKIKKAIETILHRLILEEMRRWMKTQHGLCAVEVPLLFEAGMEDEFDAVWTVVCSEETALSRLESGRHISRAEARRRLALQMDPKSKADRSDAVLINDGPLQALRAQTVELLERTAAENGMDCPLRPGSAAWKERGAGR